MYLYCLDCDVKVTIMWIKFGEKTHLSVSISILVAIIILEYIYVDTKLLTS